MNPRVGRVLLSFDHRHGCVVCTRVLFLRVLVHGGGPQHGLALGGLHRNVEVGEAGLAALLDVAEVQEESQDTWAAAQ